MDIFIISQSLKYMTYGFILSLMMFTLSISFFLYLNGREINEYYLIFFGKLKKYDMIIIATCCFVFSIFSIVLNLDDIMINSNIKQEQLENGIIKGNFFDLNINLTVKTDENKKINNNELISRFNNEFINESSNQTINQTQTAFYPLIESKKR